MKRNLVFYSACMGMLLFGIVMITLGSVLPVVTARFNLDQIGAGTLVSLLPLGILTGSLLFGPVADRYGYKILLIIASVIVLLGMEGIAFAPGVLALNLSVYAIGLGGGILNGATNALVSDISEEEKGANLSKLGVFYGLGALAMPTVLNLLQGIITTEQTILAIGGLVVFVIILFFITIFPQPKQPQGFPLSKMGLLLQSPALLVGGFFLFFVSGSETLANNWLTTYAHQVVMATEAESLVALSILVLSLTVARIMMGGILKLISSRTLIFISILMGSCAIVGIYFSDTYALLLTGVIFLGLSMGASFPIMLGYIGELFSSLSGTAFSVVLVIALSGSMTVNYSMGVIAHGYGIETMPLLLLICLISMFVLLQAFLLLTKGRLTQR